MSTPRKLDSAFFARNVHAVARELIGVTLLFNGVGGKIVEVESYDQADPAAHSFGGRTDRNAAMFGPPGFAYVYRSYGLHWCLNFVCGRESVASAVLIRAIEPQVGLPRMRRRRRLGASSDRLLCAGPGRLCQALGITGAHYGFALDQPPFELWTSVDKLKIVIGPRIGISRAKERPWRFGLAGSKFLSKPFR